MEIIDTSPKRSDFLTVICILSYIGLGWRIFKGLVSLSIGPLFKELNPFFESTWESMDNIEGMPFGNFVKNTFMLGQKAITSITPFGLLTVLFSGFALGGVIMMWNLNKNGFYIYMVFRILIVLIPVIVLGLNLFTLIGVIFSGVFASLFIIMYYQHLESMA
jgi:hypothetical protein